ARQTSSCVLPSTFTPNLVPLPLRAAHDDDVFVGRKPTSGGSRETETKLPTVIASAFPSSSVAVTTTTPVGKAPITRRNSLESKSCTVISPFITESSAVRGRLRNHVQSAYRD